MPFGAGGPVTDYKMDVGPGWAGLLDQLDAELRAIDPGYQTVQVKEKFGLLRVYVDGTPVQADIIMGGQAANVRIESTATDDNWRGLQDVIDKYENLSAGICEECGEPGTLDTQFYWRKTLCEKDKTARAETRKEAWPEKKK
jgi:hypothetical protein